MATEKKFIKKSINYYRVKNFLEKKLEKAGVSQINIQKTPVATRITLFIRRPGMVVGKRGSSIRELCEELSRDYAIDNPQLDVIEVENPQLDARLVAEKIGKQIELRGNVKQVLRFTLQEIMESGAIGAEIRIAGKVVGKGGKAKTLTARAGFLKKSGDPVKLVREGVYTAYLKAGAIGIRVRIVPPGTVFPEKIDVSVLNAPEPEATVVNAEGEEQAATGEAKADEATEEKIAEKIEEAKEEKIKQAKKPRAKKAKKAEGAEEAKEAASEEKKE
ncbi:MAG: 30S ribosomal protein S3 [Candidatus Micrarchaeia archaeon]|jgi:small subunit ribosomal protein S3